MYFFIFFLFTLGGIKEPNSQPSWLFHLSGSVGSVWTKPTEELEIASSLFDFTGTGCHWSSQIHSIQIAVSGRLEEHRARKYKA